MKTLAELQVELLNNVKAALIDFGVDTSLLTFSATGRIDLPDHRIDFARFVEKTNWSRSDMKGMRAYTLENGLLIFMPLDEYYEEYRASDALEAELEAIRKLGNSAMDGFIHAYYEAVRELNATKTLTQRIPEKLAKNLKITDSLLGVKNWQAKIVIRNSARTGAPKKGELEKVGYVRIGINHGFIIPIARSDEHNRGGDLIEHYIEKGYIPEDTYYPIVCEGLDFANPNDAIAVQAFKVWRELKGPNVVIKHNNSEALFKVTMDDYIKAEGKLDINKGTLLPIGQTFINHLRKLSNLCIEARTNERKEKALHKQAMDTYSYYLSHILSLEPKQSLDIKARLQEASDLGGAEGITKVEAICFGFDSFKNELHNEIRKALDPKSYSFQRESIEAIFGDLELANFEMGSF